MLTRFIRMQLVIFTVAGTIGVLLMIFFYMQVPTLLGIGRMTVTMELPAAGGLYRFGNVTYRGVEIGKVTSVALTRDGAKATLSLNTSPKIPANLVAEVRSISAIGEQYVELRPRTDSPPYLHNGSVIAMRDTTIPQDVGPMLDQASALIASIPKDKLHALLDESFKGFNGAGYDLGSLADSAAKLGTDLNPVGDNTRALYEDTAPLLDTQAQTADSIKLWSRSLAGVTEQLVTNDPELRRLLHDGPGAFDEASSLLEQIKPTLPVLLANLTTIGRSASRITPRWSNCWCCFRRASRARHHMAVWAIRPAYPLATSPSVWVTRRRAPSVSCLRRCGEARPTPPRSTRPTGCTASFRRIPRSRSAAPATPLAWAFRASALPPSRYARATSRINRSPCGSTRSGPIRSIPTLSDRAYRSMTESRSATTSLHRWKGRLRLRAWGRRRPCPRPLRPGAPAAGTVAPAAAPVPPPGETPHLAPPPAEGPAPGPAPEGAAPQAMPSPPGVDSAAAVGRRGSVQSAHRALRRSRRPAVPAAGPPDIFGSQDMGGSAAQVGSSA